MTRVGRVGLALLLASVAVPACEEKVDDSFQPESVPEDKPVEELDETEKEAFCDEAIEWADNALGDALPRLLCAAEGISEGGDSGVFDVAACKAAERECLANPDEEEDFDFSQATCNFEGLEDSCDVTVGEFSECFDQAAKVLNRALSELTCEKIGSGNIPNEADYQIDAACEAVLDRCGGMDDETETETPPPPE